MREPAENEKSILDRRRAGFEQFFQDSVPVLLDFIERLDLPNPSAVLQEADNYLAPVDAWLKNQNIEAEDRAWIGSRIGYFLGELLIQRHGGHWLVDEDVDSPYFSHYVVGRFIKLSTPHQKVSPFALAEYFLSQPPGRSLLGVIQRVESELHRPEETRR